MKKINKIIACISALCMAFSTSVINVYAENAIGDIPSANIIDDGGTLKYDTEKCGENISWSFDDETGTLTLSGTGSTYDYYIHTGIHIQTPWIEYKDNIKNVVIEEGITSIGNNIFNGYRYLKSVTFPESLEAIGSTAFNSCPIENLNLPSNLKTIGGGAFSCNLIKELVIPEGVTSIGYAGFSNCSNLTSVTIPSTLEYSTSLFLDCTSLTDVAMNYGLTELGDSMFDGCTSLTDITIPNSIKILGINTFENCSSLSNVKLSDNLETIKRNAFDNCSSLENISIPSSVSYIGLSAFKNTPLIDNQETYIKYADKWAVDCWYSPENHSNLDSIDLRDDTVGIAYSAFDNLNIKSVVIPASVKYINASAFDGCSSLTDITIENPDCVFSEWSICDNNWITVKPENEEYITPDGTYYIDIKDCVFTGTIHGYENSTAYDYALREGCKFSAIDSDISLELNPEYDEYYSSCKTIKNDDDLNKFILESEEWNHTENNYAVITMNVVGKDKDGNMLLSHSPYLDMSGYDENNNPIIKKAVCPEIARFLGISPDGKEIYGGHCEELVWRDDNNNVKVVHTELVDSEKNIYKTLDLNTGEDILLRHEYGYYIIENGDANIDGCIDIRDAAVLKKHIIQLKSLPDYAFTADINSDGIINIKDLGMLNKYIIKVIDKF